MNNRKATNLLLALALFWCIEVRSGGLPVKISGLGESYSKEESVRFTIRNNLDSTIRVICSIEFLNGENQWLELPYRMEDGLLIKSKLVHSLSPSETIALSWNPALIVPPSYPANREKLASGRYRVKVRLLDKQDVPDVVSEAFMHM